MHLKKLIYFFAVLAFMIAGVNSQRAAAQNEASDLYVSPSGLKVRIVSFEKLLFADKDNLIGAVFEIPEGTHIYWRNDGGAGLPSSAEWSFSEAPEKERILWTYPDPASKGTAGYVCSDKAFVFCYLKLPENLGNKDFTVNVSLNWLECSKTQCVPGSAALSKTFKTAENGAYVPSDERTSPDRELIADALPEIPDLNEAENAEASENIKFWSEKGCIKILLSGSYFLDTYSVCDDVPNDPKAVKRSLELQSEIVRDAEQVKNSKFAFYPYEGSDIDEEAEITCEYVSGAFSGSGTDILMTVPLKEGREFGNRLYGQIVRLSPKGRAVRNCWEADVKAEDKPVNFKAGAAASVGKSAGSNSEINSILPGGCVADPPVARRPEGSQISWISACFMALLGGIILNFMPCVFPVLSLKVLSFVSQASGSTEQERLRNSRRLSLWFSAGIILSFVSLAAVMLLVRSFGYSLGWGFQMQSPVFVSFILIFFWCLCLNLWGVFEIGLTASGIAGSIEAEHKSGSVWGSFISGLIAVLAAAPCTAPFMGAALGYTLTAPAYAAVSVFACLGIGMALPYAALSSYPGFLKRLPKPGAWMESFRQLLAFILAFTCIYFLSVYMEQTGIESTVMMLCALLLASMSCWIYGRFLSASGGSLWKWSAFALTSAAALVLVFYADSDTYSTVSEAPVPIYQAGEYAPWTEEGVRRALKENHPVFIDFGAAWCATCRFNESTVLYTDKTRRLFAEHSVQAFKADWTSRNIEITKALSSFGRSGVPLYVCFLPSKPDEPVILPELITYQMLADVFEKE